MLRIPCPWCGTRDESEYTFGGEAHLSRPPFDVSDDRWARYLFVRANTKGMHFERWCHSFGCGRWFNVARDTVTHAIAAAYAIDEPRPTVLRSPEASCSIGGRSESPITYADNHRSDSANPGAAG